MEDATFEIKTTVNYETGAIEFTATGEGLDEDEAATINIMGMYDPPGTPAISIFPDGSIFFKDADGKSTDGTKTSKWNFKISDYKIDRKPHSKTDVKETPEKKSTKETDIKNPEIEN